MSEFDPTFAAKNADRLQIQDLPAEGLPPSSRELLERELERFWAVERFFEIAMPEGLWESLSENALSQPPMWSSTATSTAAI